MKNLKSTKIKNVFLGGESLGEGTYGCVITDIVTQSKKKYKVAKIFLDYDQGEQEFTNAKKIRNIPGIKEFTILPEDKASFYLSNLSDEVRNKLISSCKGLDSGNEQQLLAELVYSEKGKTLSSYWKTELNVNINVLIKQLIHLCKGIDKFIENEFIHYDIKSDNIIISDDDKKAKFIDFGLSMDFSDFIDSYEEKVPYKYWPPEVYYELPIFSDYKFIRIHRSSDVNELRNVFKPKSGTPQEKEMIHKVLSEAEEKFKHQPLTTQMFIELYKFSLEKIDVFGLGVTLQEIIQILQEKDSVKNDKNKLEQLRELKVISESATNSNPSERPLPKELISKLNQIIKSNANTLKSGGKSNTTKKWLISKTKGKSKTLGK